MLDYLFLFESRALLTFSGLQPQNILELFFLEQAISNLISVDFGELTSRETNKQKCSTEIIRNKEVHL